MKRAAAANRAVVRGARAPCAYLVSLALLAAIAAGCGGHGAEKFSGAPQTPEQVYGSCSFCHLDVAAPMTAAGGHGGLALKCQSCHADLNPGFAECGHRAIPTCTGCHAAQTTHHDPAVAAPQQCTICHTAHGSSNLLLIRERLPLSGPDNMVTACSAASQCGPGELCAGTNPSCGTPTQTGGCGAPIVFTNLDGRADGSFASVSAPGTGVCEVCHTTTRYYRSDGTGEPHFDFPCFTCHMHPRGFIAQ